MLPVRVDGTNPNVGGLHGPPICLGHLGGCAIYYSQKKGTCFLLPSKKDIAQPLANFITDIAALPEECVSTHPRLSQSAWRVEHHARCTSMQQPVWYPPGNPPGCLHSPNYLFIQRISNRSHIGFQPFVSGRLGVLPAEILSKTSPVVMGSFDTDAMT